MLYIENEYLKADFRSLGGELIALWDKKTQTHRLKVGNKYWSYYAPTLFPIVGRSYNDTIWVNGDAFPMEKHGFLRKTKLSTTNSLNPHQITFELTYNEQTLKVFPYYFKILLDYKLNQNTLEVSYQIQNIVPTYELNERNAIFPCQVGGHPAFNLNAFEDLSIQDYYLQFDNEEQNTRHLINKEGYFTGQTEKIPIYDKKLVLNDSFFEKDAIILKNVLSRFVELRNTKNSHGIRVQYKDCLQYSTSIQNFVHLGLWKPVQADFLCIEPWYGCADPVDFNKPFEQKETVLLIEKGSTVKLTYFITVF